MLLMLMLLLLLLVALLRFMRPRAGVRHTRLNAVGRDPHGQANLIIRV